VGGIYVDAVVHLVEETKIEVERTAKRVSERENFIEVSWGLWLDTV